MKKSYFLLASAALLLASCSNDEVIENGNTAAIGFDMFVNNSTRATAETDITNSTLEDFSVWGATWTTDMNIPVPVFVNTTVAKNGTDWTYTPLRYWIVGNNYRFSALAPANPSGVTVEQMLPAITDEPKGGLKITFDNSVAKGAVDLCYAYNTVMGAAAGQGKVALNFGHMLSRVKFTFKNTFPNANSIIRVSDVKITNATAKATVNKVDGDDLWTASTDAPGTFELPFPMIVNPSTNGNIAGGTSTNNEGVTEHQYIIPVKDGMAYNLSFKVQLVSYDASSTAEDKYTVLQTYVHNECALPEVAFKNNLSYNFVAEINQKNIDPDQELTPIMFTPTVTAWEDFTDTNVNHTHQSEPTPGN